MLSAARADGCRYSRPQKSPDTDLDQVDKSLPPYTGILVGQMERQRSRTDGEGLFSWITFSPLLENVLHVKSEAERADGLLSPAL